MLVGGTASGKKRVAAELHRRTGCAVLSMDSMKVYRGMDIGTDKPDAELRASTPFALLDIVGHDETFTAGEWLAAAEREVAAADAAGRGVLFAGGTPFYLKLLIDGLFPGPAGDETIRAELDDLWSQRGEAAVRALLAEVDPVTEERLSSGDKKRVIRALEVQRLTGRSMSDWQREDTVRRIGGDFVVAALRRDKDEHERRLRARVDAMFAGGLLDEVAALQERAPFADESGRSIGYQEARDVLAEKMTRAAAAERTSIRTRQLVRRQRIFIDGFGPERITWVDIAQDASAASVADDVAMVFESGPNA